MNTGTIKSITKLQELDNKWQQKKNELSSGMGKNNKKSLGEMTADERMLAEFQERAEKERESNEHADIYNKLKSGKELTEEEIEYLEQNDPEALSKYREDQARKEAYERALKNCRTKDEVERVKMNALGEFSAQAKKIVNNPYIPKDKKVQLMNQLNNKLCMVNDAHMKFVTSQEYENLPTEAEIQEERAENTADNTNAVNNEALEKESTDWENAVNKIDDNKTSLEDEDLMSADYEEGSETAFEKTIKMSMPENIVFDTASNVVTKQISFEKLSADIAAFVRENGKKHSELNIGV